MFIPLELIIIGIDPYPYVFVYIYINDLHGEYQFNKGLIILIIMVHIIMMIFMIRNHLYNMV